MSLEITVQDLRKFELLNHLEETTLEDMLPLFKKRILKRKELVYATNDFARHFFFVLSGSIKIFRLSEDGKEQIIRTIHPKEFTGELALFGNERKAYASAIEESIILSIKHQDFKNLLMKIPELSLKMIEILATRLHLSEAQTSLLSMNTSKERLWIHLNSEARIKDNKKIFTFTQTKRFLASYLGMSSETFSRMLHKLEDEDKIKILTDETIEIL